MSGRPRCLTRFSRTFKRFLFGAQFWIGKRDCNSQREDTASQTERKGDACALWTAWRNEVEIIPVNSMGRNSSLPRAMRHRAFSRFCHAFTVKPFPKIKHTEIVYRVTTRQGSPAKESYLYISCWSFANRNHIYIKRRQFTILAKHSRSNFRWPCGAMP